MPPWLLCPLRPSAILHPIIHPISINRNFTQNQTSTRCLEERLVCINQFGSLISLFGRATFNTRRNLTPDHKKQDIRTTSPQRRAGFGILYIWESQTGTSSAIMSNSIKVVARFRPQNRREIEAGGQPIVAFDADDTCTLDVCLCQIRELNSANQVCSPRRPRARLPLTEYSTWIRVNKTSSTSQFGPRLTISSTATTERSSHTVKQAQESHILWWVRISRMRRAEAWFLEL